jgi:hypothetical protein
MPTDLENHPDQSLAALVTGIVHDIQELVEKQVRLARHDLETGLQKVKSASLLAAAGAVVLVPGLVLLAAMAALGLHWLGSPPGTDTATIPLWVCFGLVGGAFILAGGGLILAGSNKVSSQNALPAQSVKALEENLEWKTNPK